MSSAPSGRKRGRQPTPCPDYDALRRAYEADPRLAIIARELGTADAKKVRRWLGEIGIEIGVKTIRPRGVTPAYARVARTPSGKRVTARLYEIWCAMRKRCYGPYREDFHHYGGRGITVCDEWREDYDAFRAWAIANGYRKDLTIDRIDSNGNYEPSNCRWATREEQTYNNSGTQVITFNGETLPSPVWAKRLGLHPQVLRGRLNHGWSIEHALTVPKGALRPGMLRGRAAAKARRILSGYSADSGSSR